MKVAGNKLIAECTAYDFKVAVERGKVGHWLKSDSRLEPGQWNGERQTLVPDKGLPENEKGAQKKYPENGKIPPKTEKKVPRKSTQKKYPVNGSQVRRSDKINPTAQLILDRIVENGGVTRKELVEYTGVSDAAVKKNLKKLKDLGIIERVGPDKGGYWKVIVKK